MLEYFTLNSKWITKWKSKGLSNENIKIVSKTDNILTPSINYYGDKDKFKIYRKCFATKNSYTQP